MQVKALEVLPEHAIGGSDYITPNRVYDVLMFRQVGKSLKQVMLIDDVGDDIYITDPRVDARSHGVIWEVVDAS